MTALKPLGSAQREISLRHSLFEEAIALVRNSAVGVLVTAIQVIAGSAWRWCTSERKRRPEKGRIQYDRYRSIFE